MRCLNPYGGAQLNVVGGAVAGNRWLDEDSGHQGVWVVGRQNGSSGMVATVKNRPEENLYKDIWLQITYSSQTRRSSADPGFVSGCCGCHV